MSRKLSMQYVKGFKKVFRVGYCDLQTLFTGFSRVGYNCGVYGWNNDIFVDYSTDICITTGYRNMRGERIPTEIIEKYETTAREILKSRVNWYYIEKRLNNLRADFFGELSQL